MATRSTRHVLEAAPSDSAGAVALDGSCGGLECLEGMLEINGGTSALLVELSMSKAMLAKGSTHLLSFNEPDIASQANMAPKQAAAAHPKYMNPYGDQARIGGPVVSNSGEAGQSADWLETFMAEGPG